MAKLFYINFVKPNSVPMENYVIWIDMIVVNLHVSSSLMRFKFVSHKNVFLLAYDKRSLGKDRYFSGDAREAKEIIEKYLITRSYTTVQIHLSQILWTLSNTYIFKTFDLIKSVLDSSICKILCKSKIMLVWDPDFSFLGSYIQWNF